MSNYQNGKIYKIVNDSSNLVYYGSTIQPLYKRFYKHKTQFHLCTSKKILDGENPQIVLVEDCPCERREQLFKRERYYIENNVCVNKNIPGRTLKEWEEDNRERLKKKKKEYREDNKEKLKKQKKEYRENNKEKILEYFREWREENKEKILEYFREWREENKDKIKKQSKEWREKNKEKLSEKFNCDCGGSYSVKNKARHLKTKKHIKFIKVKLALEQQQHIEEPN